MRTWYTFTGLRATAVLLVWLCAAITHAATFPAEVLNLTNWKITLPVGTGSSPTEIKQPALATFSDASYFHLNAAGTGVVFKAHCGGVTTSGSGYPRSELREMTNGGRDNASWSTGSGTHVMYLRQAITHLPDVKPHVVAGQIHDASDDVIVIRLEDRKLFVDHNGNDGPVLTSAYALGTIFTVKFEAANGRVRIYYNDSPAPADDYAVAATGCYFKAGCYTQSNVSKGDSANAYGEVVIYDLQVNPSTAVHPRPRTGAPETPVPSANRRTFSGQRTCDLLGRLITCGQGDRVPRLNIIISPDRACPTIGAW